jgi:hypothetical protein
VKKLKTWNGGIYPWRGQHGYVCAYSRADAIRLMNEVNIKRRLPPITDSEMKSGWSACWGNAMDGITPERGFWVTMKDGGPVERLA